MSISSFTR